MKARIPWQPTKEQRKVMREEIHKNVIKANKQYENDVDAMVLYALHVHLGFGKRRLRRFYDELIKIRQKLVDHYQMPTDTAWICMRKLKEIGVDVEAWNKETPIVYQKGDFFDRQE